MFKKREARSFRRRDRETGGFEEGGEELQTAAKRQKTEGGLQFTTKDSVKKSEVHNRSEYDSNQALAARDEYRERTLVEQDGYANDERARKEEQMKRSAAPGVQLEGTYKGQHGYVDFRQGFRREANLSSNKASGMHGPIRASAAIRVTARFDYQPDLCKDYKETGYCAYGDSCKFLHDRSDYKAGWQIEKEWEEQQKKKVETAKLSIADDSRGLSSTNQVPFACLKCRKAWSEVQGDPVVTLCRHYFCQSCAMEQGQAKKKRERYICPVCEQNTQGIYNTAWDVVKLQSEGLSNQQAQASNDNKGQ